MLHKRLSEKNVVNLVVDVTKPPVCFVLFLAGKQTICAMEKGNLCDNGIRILDKLFLFWHGPQVFFIFILPHVKSTAINL